jgi:hypothetical protein
MLERLHESGKVLNVKYIALAVLLVAIAVLEAPLLAQQTPQPVQSDATRGEAVSTTTTPPKTA